MIELRAGDPFSTFEANFLDDSIGWIETIRSLSAKKATYAHSGFLIDKVTSFEALYHYTEQNFFKAYGGKQVIIVRFKDMTPEKFNKGFASVKNNLGGIYPIYRLGLHLLRFAKYVHFKKTVCSECTEEMLVNAGMTTLTQGNWWGVKPQDLVDDWRISKYVDVIFEGILPENNN